MTEYLLTDNTPMGAFCLCDNSFVFELLESKGERPLHITAGERRFLKKNILNFHGVILFSDKDGNVHCLITGSLHTVGLAALFTPSAALSYYEMHGVYGIGREILASERTLSIIEKQSGTATRGLVDRLLNLNIYLGRGTQTGLRAFDIQDSAEVIAKSIATLCGRDIRVSSSIVKTAQSIDISALGLLLIASLSAEQTSDAPADINFFSEGDGLSVKICTDGELCGLSTVSALFERIGLGFCARASENGTEITASVSRPEVSLLDLKQDPLKMYFNKIKNSQKK